ncbi:hypothetical protein [uncultured Xanthomonas sp.]|uniref:hypothetical protein n=1 Tax=uncultured Xanthomonas sp. TaxID=152831 RepID=UPI003747D386
MNDTIETLLQGEPEKWIADLPEFQRAAIQELRANGATYDDVAQAWITASAEHTYRFSASAPVGDKSAFLDSLRKEVRAFLCGDKKYKKEREGLFGDKGLARTYVVSTMAVAIAPYLSVASAVIAPLIALVLASVGKIALNAWCSLHPE